MAKLKFSLKIGDESIRSIADLQDNFDEEDVLYNYKNQNTLCRWLDVWGFSEYLEKVKAISSTDDDQIIKELAEIFEVELSNKTDFEKLLDKADKLYEKDLFDDALDTLEKALLLEPNNDEVLQKIESCKEEIMQTANPRGIVPDKFKANNIKQKNYSGEEDNCVKYLEYKEQSGGIVITGIDDDYFYNITEEDKYGKLNIPSKIEGISVISIGDHAFYWSMRFEDMLKLTHSLTKYMRYAFDDCSSLKEITIPDSVTSIGSYAFKGCLSLREIAIPDSVTSIGHEAFCACIRLKEITIPDSVTSIGYEAFCYCHSLKEIIIPDSVTSIEEHVFTCCLSLEEITIPDSVTSIGQFAFAYCDSLEEITIPNSVTSIGQYAFNNCSRLENITAPNHLRNDLSEYSDITTYRN